MKKNINQINYKKGTVAQNKDEIIEILEASTEIEVKQQIIFNDDSQAITLKVHYFPEPVKR